MRTRVFTVAQVADMVGKPKQAVEGLFRKKGIKPALRIGNTRLFDEIAVERLRLVLPRSKTWAATGKNNEH